MINVTLAPTDALNVLKSDNLPSILRIQLVEAVSREFVEIVTHSGKVENRVSYLEAEIRGAIEMLEEATAIPHKYNTGDIKEFIVHLRSTL